MTSVVKSAADTTTAVFTTVGTAANQITNVVNTTGQAIDMLSSFVTTARTKQKARTAIDLAIFNDQLVEDTALEQAMRQREIQQKLEADPALTKLYAENSKKFGDILSNLNSVPTE